MCYNFGPAMLQEEVPKNLSDRTGKHVCIRCLAETPAEDYFRNDHVCDACAAGLDADEPGVSLEETSSG
jgi:hypothetical protein